MILNMQSRQICVQAQSACIIFLPNEQHGNRQESLPLGITASTFINVVRVNYTHHYLLVLSGGELISHK